MKVLQLTVHFSPNVGGVETHLDDLVDGLVSRRIDTFVLCYRPLATKATWQIWQTKTHLKILRLPWIPGLFYRLINSPVGEFIYLSIGLWLVLPWVLLIWQPKLVHAHGLVAGFVAVFWSKIFGVKTLISTHSLYHFPKTGLYRVLASWIFRHANQTICLSDQSVDEIRSLGANKVGRFCYWVDQDRFKPGDKNKAKKELGITKPWMVFFIGRLIEIKGVKVLLAIVKKLPSQVQLVIAGDGELNKSVIEASAKSNGRLKFVGRLNGDEAAKYYRAADLVVVPSIHDEGFGRVILEALSSGTPVIGSDRGAIPEAMDNSVGKLIEVNEENLLESIDQLTKSRVELTKMSQRARKYAQAKYSSKNLKLIVDQY